jgi:hypothetical protein
MLEPPDSDPSTKQDIQFPFSTCDRSPSSSSSSSSLEVQRHVQTRLMNLLFRPHRAEVRNGSNPRVSTAHTGINGLDRRKPLSTVNNSSLIYPPRERHDKSSCISISTTNTTRRHACVVDRSCRADVDEEVGVVEGGYKTPNYIHRCSFHLSPLPSHSSHLLPSVPARPYRLLV